MTERSRRSARRVLYGLVLAALSVALVAPVADAAAKTKRVSKRTGGGAPNGESFNPSTSSNGRFVAFSSKASDLIGNDGNSFIDIFVHDRKSGQTKRVSKPSGGGIPDDASGRPSISGNGRFVAFRSDATNLIGSDGNTHADVFVHDRKIARTKRVSKRKGGATPNGDSGEPWISANGRFVAFESDATNLIGGDGNGKPDVFVHDRKTGRTKRVSKRKGGGDADGSSSRPSISADGRFVAFESTAKNLVGSDGNDKTDVFVHDRKAGRTKRVSKRVGGGDANGFSDTAAISANGRFVAFTSSAKNLIGSDGNNHADVFVFDRKTGKTKRVSKPSGGGIPNGESGQASISANGRHVAFESIAKNLIGNDGNDVYDVFVHDRKTGKTKRVSKPSGGGIPNGESFDGSISADGRFVAFDSGANNLISNDDNLWFDIFVRGPGR